MVSNFLVFVRRLNRRDIAINYYFLKKSGKSQMWPHVRKLYVTFVCKCFVALFWLILYDIHEILYESARSKVSWQACVAVDFFWTFDKIITSACGLVARCSSPWGRCWEKSASLHKRLEKANNTLQSLREPKLAPGMIFSCRVYDYKPR